jgi:hypothetical protein
MKPQQETSHNNKTRRKVTGMCHIHDKPTNITYSLIHDYCVATWTYSLIQPSHTLAIFKISHRSLPVRLCHVSFLSLPAVPVTGRLHSPSYWLTHIYPSTSQHHTFHPEDGGSKVFQNGPISHHYMTSQLGRPQLESLPLQKPQILFIYIYVNDFMEVVIKLVNRRREQQLYRSSLKTGSFFHTAAYSRYDTFHTVLEQ